MILVQGLIYIFFSYQTLFGKVFWILVVLLMLILGLYWCVLAYINWQNKPVLTTITTTAYNVKQVKNLQSSVWTCPKSVKTFRYFYLYNHRVVLDWLGRHY